ncbi:MAG: ABC transporter substrate-binding protein [Xenococcaceae cyanobacterium MO_188.B29]|nr:ABC transporter substrate-binding protein [Xenococcaceae cyanobacterium MO_188.B29]
MNRSSPQDRVLEVWWDKGFYPEEDEALQQVLSEWEQETGNQVRLSLHNNDELFLKTERAIQADNPPDVLMNDAADRFLNPGLAWQGKLSDLADLIEPIKDSYSDPVLASVYFYNEREKRRSYYAIPIHIGIPHIFYWRDLLQQVGKSEQDIPQDWDAFWKFWQQVQDQLLTEGVYGLGLPMSVEAADTDDIFEQILEAYNVEILDSEGELQVDNPQVRQGIIDCINWYTQFYIQGYVPPKAVKWLNPDNNRSLLNKLVVMTPNQSLSIPAAVKQDQDIYYHQLVTTGYPDKPNGKPMRYIAMIRQAIVLADSNKQKLAKDFLTYFNQPEVLSKYLKAAGGRYLPVNKQILTDTFWTDPADPHISTAIQPFLQEEITLPYTVLNPAYSIVLKDSIWGKALTRVVIDRHSPEQAADEAIAQIKKIFAQWK